MELKTKILRLYYQKCLYCEFDIAPAVVKFYSQFNNTMAVIGRYKNKIAAVYPTKSFRMSSVLYACEIWSLKMNGNYSANVALDNSFRQIFNCCWHKNPKMLLFYCSFVASCTQCRPRSVSYSFLPNDKVSQQCFTKGTCKNVLF